MNRKAIINNREYALLEIVPPLDRGQVLLLRENENGKRAVCSEPLWRSCALMDVQSAPVQHIAPRWIFLLLVEKIQMYFGSKTGYGRRVLSLSGNAE